MGSPWILTDMRMTFDVSVHIICNYFFTLNLHINTLSGVHITREGHICQKKEMKENKTLK